MLTVLVLNKGLHHQASRFKLVKSRCIYVLQYWTKFKIKKKLPDNRDNVLASSMLTSGTFHSFLQGRLSTSLVCIAQVPLPENRKNKYTSLTFNDWFSFTLNDSSSRTIWSLFYTLYSDYFVWIGKESFCSVYISGGEDIVLCFKCCIPLRRHHFMATCLNGHKG